ncbi:hypothetical protein [Streptomyces sp. NPDC048650]|uniref:hypothetical protein n=1 Tax=unclassified Streptomyces TaxID=2593676 RepID=UPI003719B628
MQIRRTATTITAAAVLGLGVLAGTAHADSNHPVSPVATKSVSSVSASNWWNGKLMDTEGKYKLRYNPKKSSKPKGTLPSGTEVRILVHNKKTHWDKVKLTHKAGGLKKGTTGYVKWSKTVVPTCMEDPRPCNDW